MNKTLGENTIYQILKGLTVVLQNYILPANRMQLFVHNTTPYIHPRPDFDWLRQFRLDINKFDTQVNDIIVLFVLSKLILQTSMRIHPVGLGV